MNTEMVKRQLQNLESEVNSKHNMHKIKFCQQKVIERHMSFTGGNGRLCIEPRYQLYNIGLSGQSLTKEMYQFMCELTGKSHDKYGYPAKKSLPKWEVSSFETLKKAVYRYANTLK